MSGPLLCGTLHLSLSREFHFIPTPELRLVFKLGGSCELVIKVRGKVWLAAHRSLLQALAVLRSCSRVSSLAMDTKEDTVTSVVSDGETVMATFW